MTSETIYPPFRDTFGPFSRPGPWVIDRLSASAMIRRVS
jgi:hypothetical protein